MNDTKSAAMFRTLQMPPWPRPPETAESPFGLPQLKALLPMAQQDENFNGMAAHVRMLVRRYEERGIAVMHHAGRGIRELLALRRAANPAAPPEADEPLPFLQELAEQWDVDLDYVVACLRFARRIAPDQLQPILLAQDGYRRHRSLFTPPVIRQLMQEPDDEICLAQLKQALRDRRLPRFPKRRAARKPGRAP